MLKLKTTPDQQAFSRAKFALSVLTVPGFQNTETSIPYPTSAAFLKGRAEEGSEEGNIGGKDISLILA